MELYKHQIDIIERSKTQRSLALFWQMGSGKTRGTIEILRLAFNTHKKVMRTVVLAPSSVIFNWKDEFCKWSKIPEEKVHVITGSGAKRVKNLKAAIANQGVIIINWEALLNKDILSQLLSYRPEVLIGDELHYIKSYKSSRSKSATLLSDVVREGNGYVIGLTGTPIINSPEDIFMQFKFLDGGQLFGKNFFHYRHRYMVNANAGWSGPNSFEKWLPNSNMFEELNKKINSLASRVTKEECLRDLPPLVRTKRVVSLGPEQARAYKSMEKDFIAFVEDSKTPAIATVAVVKGLKLMETISGYLTDEKGDVHVFKNNPRLKELESLLDEILPNKVIIWGCWKQNYKDIEALCKKKKLKYTCLLGGLSAEEKKERQDLFCKSDDVNIAIASRKAAGTGINLIEAAYSIVYSRNFSLEDELQSEARNYRGGSQMHEKIIKIDIVAKDTIDERVCDALASKEKVSDHIIDWRF